MTVIVSFSGHVFAFRSPVINVVIMSAAKHTRVHLPIHTLHTTLASLMSFAIPVIGDASDIRTRDLRVGSLFRSTFDPGSFREIDCIRLRTFLRPWINNRKITEHLTISFVILTVLPFTGQYHSVNSTFCQWAIHNFDINLRPSFDEKKIYDLLWLQALLGTE